MPSPPDVFHHPTLPLCDFYLIIPHESHKSLTNVVKDKRRFLESKNVSVSTKKNGLILQRNFDTICCERKRGRGESKLEGCEESLRGL
jgi:hypothetical protein